MTPHQFMYPQVSPTAPVVAPTPYPAQPVKAAPQPSK